MTLVPRKARVLLHRVLHLVIDLCRPFDASGPEFELLCGTHADEHFRLNVSLLVVHSCMVAVDEDTC